MTDDDALVWIEFLDARMFGWDVVMGIDPETGRTDFRTRRAKSATELQRDLWFNRPSLELLLQSVMAERDAADLWPETMRETVRFRMEHKVPRAPNEPTSDHYREMKREAGGEDWPDFVLSHGKPATVDDHPPFPPRSDLYNAWKADADAEMASEKVIARHHARKAGRRLSDNDNTTGPRGAA